MVRLFNGPNFACGVETENYIKMTTVAVTVNVVSYTKSWGVHTILCQTTFETETFTVKSLAWIQYQAYDKLMKYLPQCDTTRWEDQMLCQLIQPQHQLIQGLNTSWPWNLQSGVTLLVISCRPLTLRLIPSHRTFGPPFCILHPELPPPPLLQSSTWISYCYISLLHFSKTYIVLHTRIFFRGSWLPRP